MRTCRASRSSSEYTATVAMPSSRQVRMTRTAISARLAIRTFWNTQRLSRGDRADENHHTGTARRVGAMCADRPRRAEPARSTEPAVAGAELSFTATPGPAGTRFGPVRRFAEIDSTNRYLLDAARAGAPEGAVAVADYQRAGRGRLGRRWEAPPGSNLLVSVLLRPRLAVEELHLCTVAVALAASAACEQGAGVVPDLKWPNDLMVGDRKLGGILAEALPAGTSAADADDGTGRGSTNAPAVVVGLGLNVGWP